jgi:hypothetical protein
MGRGEDKVQEAKERNQYDSEVVEYLDPFVAQVLNMLAKRLLQLNLVELLRFHKSSGKRAYGNTLSSAKQWEESRRYELVLVAGTTNHGFFRRTYTSRKASGITPHADRPKTSAEPIGTQHIVCFVLKFSIGS